MNYYYDKIKYNNVIHKETSDVYLVIYKHEWVINHYKMFLRLKSIFLRLSRFTSLVQKINFIIESPQFNTIL